MLKQQFYQGPNEKMPHIDLQNNLDYIYIYK